MLDINQDDYRRYIAELTVQRFMIAKLWETFLADWPEEDRRKGLDDLLRMGSNMAHRATDEADAEAAADVIVIGRERLRDILTDIAKRTGTDWTPTVDDPLASLRR